MGLVESMAGTQKGLKSAKTDGGFFYFVGDSKGENAALMVLGKKKDENGKKTFRQGRRLLQDFKKEYGKALYSQGQIRKEGSSLIFSITKGSAKPAIIKRAFKASSVLHEGVGKALVGLLKSAKITMDAGDSSAPPERTSLDDDAMSAWKARPETQELIGSLEMSDEELAELFDAEKAFNQHAEALPRSLDEDTELQLRQAETEALLDELAEGEAELERLRTSDPDKVLALEDQLNDRRIELAQKNATGPDPFRIDELAGPEKETYAAAVRAGVALLLDRVQTVRREIANELARFDTLSPGEQEAAALALAEKRQTLQQELEAIQKQAAAARAL